MNITKTVTLLTALMICLFLVGCKPGSDVVGTWKNANVPEMVEFKKDHTGVFSVQNSPSLPFTWSRLADGRIEVKVDFMGKVNTLHGRMEQETFVLTGKGEQAVYHKVK